MVTRTFAHDAAGNMSADTRGGVAYQYGYNANNRLESVSTGGLLKGTYVYNAFEQLVSRTRVNMSPAGTIHLIHDRDGNVIAETDGAGNTVREYVWLPDSQEGGTALPLAVVSEVNTATPVTYFVHADHLNRPVLMTDATKQVVWSASYLPFGGEYQISGPAALDARFPGQWFQLESGLSYNWHRHYDASLGRYTQPDPLGFVDGPSRYAYAVNSPTGVVDPTGQAGLYHRHMWSSVFDWLKPNACYGPDNAGDLPPLGPLLSEFPPGFWPGDRGAEEWGRRNGVNPDAARRKFHGIKQGDKGKGKDKYGVNPDTGDVANPDGEIVGNLDE